MVLKKSKTNALFFWRQRSRFFPGNQQRSRNVLIFTWDEKAGDMLDFMEQKMLVKQFHNAKKCSSHCFTRPKILDVDLWGNFLDVSNFSFISVKLYDNPFFVNPGKKSSAVSSITLILRFISSRFSTFQINYTNYFRHSVIKFVYALSFSFRVNRGGGQYPEQLSSGLFSNSIKHFFCFLKLLGWYLFF